MRGNDVPVMGTFGDRGRGSRWQRCPHGEDHYGMEGREAGGRGVLGMETLGGWRARRWVGKISLRWGPLELEGGEAGGRDVPMARTLMGRRGRCCSTSGGFGSTVPGGGFNFELQKAQNTRFHPIACVGKPCPANSAGAGGPAAATQSDAVPARGGGLPAAQGAVSPRLSPKRRPDGPKGSSARSSRSPSSPSPRRSASPHQNGHKGSAQNGRHSHGAPLPEPSDVRRLFLDHRSLPSTPPSAGPPTLALLSPPSPLARLPPRPAWAHGGMRGAGCTPPAPTASRWVHGLPGGASPPPRGRYRGSQQGIPHPTMATHRSTDVTHPQGRWLGRPVSPARVTAGLSTSLGVD